MRMRRAVVLQLRSPRNLRFPALRERSGPARLGLTWSGRGGGGRWDGQHFGPASPPPSPPRPAAPPPPARAAAVSPAPPPPPRCPGSGGEAAAARW